MRATISPRNLFRKKESVDVLGGIYYCPPQIECFQDLKGAATWISFWPQPTHQHNTTGAESMLQSHAVPVVWLYINNTLLEQILGNARQHWTVQQKEEYKFSSLKDNI
jgi:hypothetical protein